MNQVPFSLGLLQELHVPAETQARVVRWLKEYCNAPPTYWPQEIRRGIFESIHDELVIVKDIQFTALCEHHLLPFIGKAAVGYIPNGRILGLSKMARIVHLYTTYPTLQEAITTAVADSIEQELKPKGVMVVLYDVMHSCMSMRGVKEREATTTTSAVRGVFKQSQAARLEFLELIKR